MSLHQLPHNFILYLCLALLEANPRLNESRGVLTVGVISTGDKNDFKLASMEFVPDDHLVSIPLKGGA